MIWSAPAPRQREGRRRVQVILGRGKSASERMGIRAHTGAKVLNGGNHEPGGRGGGAVSELFVIACGHRWGIGTYRYPRDEDWGQEFGYGFPWNGMDPEDFTPDEEGCTSQEIALWEADRLAWAEQFGPYQP